MAYARILRKSLLTSSRKYILQHARGLSSAESLPSQADAVIIGGGSIGTSTLYHLQKLGVNAVLIEANKLTSGTTWHSAGLCWQLAGMAGQMDTDIESVQYTKKMVSETLPAETGGDWAGWENVGAIFACSSRERQIMHNRTRLLAQAIYEIEAYDLTPSEAKDVHPLMNVDDLFGAVYVPGDGTIDPTAMTNAYAKAAKMRGGKVWEDTRVTAIHQQDGQVTGVSTTAGDIRTNKVVNCAGAWARKIASMAGVHCPLLAYKHAYVVTEEIPGLKGLPSIRDYNRSVYMKVSGGAFHIGGYENNPIRIQTADGWDIEDEFAFGLYDLDYDVFTCHLEAHINRVPAIEEVGIASTVCGPESFTADHRPLMGETPELRGFFLGCGLNSAGIMYSGGFGRELASWVATGRAKTDVFGFDARRFHPDCVGREDWLVERCHETYANQSIIPWAHDQPLAGRNMRTSPFHDALIAAGGVLVESHGFERPGWFAEEAVGDTAVKPYDFMGAYDTPTHDAHTYAELLEGVCNYHIHEHWVAEHHACRENVALFDTSAFGKLKIHGDDAADAMEWLCSNTVAKGAGNTTYTTLCNAEGTVEADLTVSALDDGSFYMCTAGATLTHDLAHIRHTFAAGGFKAAIEDITDDIGILSVQGPRSRDLLEKITDGAVDFSNESFPFGTHQPISVAGHDGVRAIRITFMGELGWELHVPRDAGADVHRALMAAGEEFGVRNAGYFATGSLSLEKGYRHWHADLRCTDTPMAAGLGFTCKFKTDTPFLGREALEQVRSQPHKGLNGRVACFTAGHVGEGEAAVPLHGNEPLYRDDQFVGFLRTAGFGFSLQASIGYAWVYPPDGVEGQKMVSMKYLKSGDYEVHSYEHGRVPARFHAKPPFDPKGGRIQGNYE